MHRRLRPGSPFSVWLALAAAGLVGWFGGARGFAAPPSAAELILRGSAAGEDADGSELSPSMAFEVRFAENMVGVGERDKAGAESPLRIVPPLAGNFVWTSQRGGVFTPTEPPPLGTSYRVKLRDGLADAAGQPVRADVDRTFHTPSLEVRGRLSNLDNPQPTLGPSVQLLCNAAVNPDQIAPALAFRPAGGGKAVPAVAVAAPEKLYYPFDPKVPRRTWRELFVAAHASPTTQESDVPTPPVLNRVIVTPSAPLPPGKGWVLVAAEGMRGIDPGARLPAEVTIPVGDVVPFEVTKVEPVNEGVDARRLLVHLSRVVDQAVTPENVSEWLGVEPKPEHLKFQVQRDYAGSTVEIDGDFGTMRYYTVTVRAGLPAAGHFYTLAEAVTRAAWFDGESPQVAFPDFRVQQFGNGRREFAFSARNAPEVRVRAKLVPPEQAAEALIAYDAVNYNRREGGYVEGKRVDFDHVPGRVVYDQPVAGSKQDDVPETVTLRWDDILGKGRNGTVLLEAEQQTPTPGQKQRAGAQAFVQVTDLGIVWKTSPGGKLLTYVFSMTDAAPAAASVQLLDAKGQPIGTKAAVSREDGVALLSAGVDKAAWLAVSAGGDCHVLPFKSDRRDALGLYRYHLPATAFAEDTYGAEAADDVDGDDDPAAGKKAAAPKPPRREVLLFSERGVYKPGEEAHVKGIVRDWQGGGLVNVAAGTPATLSAYDAKGRRFWQKDDKLSAAGTVSETIPLPSAGLGHYRVEISFDGKKAADAGEAGGDDKADSADTDDDADEDSDEVKPNVCRFQVQEYQPNAFVVTLAKPAVAPVGPGVVPVALDAHYYMGKTLSHAKTAWSLKAVDTDFKPEGFDDYVFGGEALENRFDRPPGELALDGQGALSAKGELSIAPSVVLNTASPTPRRVRLQASVTDEDQQTVTARTAFTVESSDFYLGVREMPELLKVGEPLPLEVIAVKAGAGQPLDETVQVTAKLSRIEWHNNRVANDSGHSDYDNKRDLLPVAEMPVQTTGVRRVGREWEPQAEADALRAALGESASGNVAAAGPVGDVKNLVPTEPGEYALEVSAQDAKGRAVHTAVTFEVLGDKEAEWGYRNAWQLPLVPDKVEYHAGDTATLLVKTPISGKALVTVEREGVSRAFVTDIVKEHPVVQVPIRASDAPNVFVSVLLMRGSVQSPRRVKEPEYRSGYCQLVVPKTDTRLAVVVQPDKGEYQPGEQVNVEVAVADEAQRPAAGAEVTLYAVDKGVLSLTGYALPEPLKAFYHPRPLDVETGLTLPDLLSENPDDLNFSGDKGYAANKGYLVGGGGDEGRGDRLRQNFVACAYWNATLVTDAQGKVRASFVAPDSLTEYAVMAVVNEGGHPGDANAAGRFGGGQGMFKVNKPLMLEPALPRFGNVGDHLVLRAVAHNQSPVDGDAEITLDLDDKASLDGADTAAARVRKVRLAAGESKPVEFPVTFTHTGEAQWTWHARLVGAGSNPPVWRDAVQSTLLVDHPTPRRSEVIAGHAENGKAEDLLAHVDPTLLEGEDGVIEVNVSTTRLSELSDGVDALLHYPYGCVEQTTSSLMPWLALKDFRDVLPALSHTPQEVDGAVARGVDRLVGMQTESGGLAYWPDVTGRDPSPWGSAYGGLGLALAKRAGYFVPAASLNKLCNYLSELLRSDAPAAHDTYHEHSETDRCLALYALALAGKGESAYYEKFYDRRAELSPEDRTLLALAIAEDKGSADMIRTFLQPGTREKEAPDKWNEFATGSALDAMRLLAWCRFQPTDPAVDGRITRLLDDRTGEGTWETTQGNAWAVLAMAAYAHAVEKPGRGVSGTVALGGQEKPFQLKGQMATFTCSFPFAADLVSGKEKLSVQASDKGRLYVQTKVESRPRGAALSAAPSNGEGGYIIQRRYEKLLDDGMRVPAEDLKVGDRVLVTLQIEAPDRASYVAVNDPLPAVLEAVNPEFKTSGAGGNAPQAGMQWWVSDYRELRTDRAVFFCDHLYAGRFHLQYLARVRAAGTAIAPAAKIEEMYRPTHYAETAAASLTSKPLE